MALRVLLADESPTIKKVFQLALQDFAVDVRSVALGPDVSQVAQQFKPDIIFCDVLLQKKSGYDVSAELKGDAQLKSTPVVLMWSGFMDLDQDKFQAAMADGSLEKPFEVADLRQLVHQFVPRTRNQKLSDYLKFPKMPEIIEPQPENAAAEPPAAPANWSMDSFAPVPDVTNSENDEFKEVPLPPRPQEVEETTQWAAKPLKKFQVDLPAAEQDQLAVKWKDQETTPEPELNIEGIPAIEEEFVPTAGALSPEQIEKIVVAHCRELIESIAWKVVPDLATQIIERELSRLLAEKKSSSSP
jgi:two-component system, cell cycle response regulator